MAVVSTPVSARARLTYLNGEPSLTVSGINPAITPMQFTSLANALQILQDATVQDGYLITENDLVRQ